VNRTLAEKVADAVLYEGYMLYPYRPSAMKNRQRWTFGTIYPPDYGEVSRGTESACMHTEFLLNTAEVERSELQCTLRFLHVLARKIRYKDDVEVPSSEGGNLLESWDEATPRTVDFELSAICAGPAVHHFQLPGVQGTEIQCELNGSLRASAERLLDNLLKITIEVRNETSLLCDVENRSRALPKSFLSAHLILSVEDGEFVSLLDAPHEFREFAATCRNSGVFPVLVGNPGDHDMLFCSPILLYDYPQIAPESSGDFYDATEIDEMLTLRVMTLTDEEKQEMRLADDRVRAILDRTEATAREQLMRTHGTLRNLRPASGE